MPVPTRYTCSGCDFQGSSRGGWGQFEYQAAHSVRFDIPRTDAICHDCASVCPVEIYPDRRHWQQLDEKARTGSRNNWDIFYPWYIEIKVLQKLMRSRTTPPRCLVCGGHDFDVIPSERPGLVHRGCGGIIQVDDQSGPWLYYGDGERLPKRLYSMDGLEIKDFRAE